MDLISIFGTQWFNWIIMPLIIFISRVLDVSFGTLRVIFISQGYKIVATLVGFFEVLIWILVARQVITNLENFLWIIAYAGGYAAGTYIGILICEKLKIGKVAVRVILKKKGRTIIDELRENGFGVTVMEGKGVKTKSHIIFSTLKLKELSQYMNIVRKHNPKAFYTVESVREVREAAFKQHAKAFKLRNINFSQYSLRKSK